jgi:hypothetical protein
MCAASSAHDDECASSELASSIDHGRSPTMQRAPPRLRTPPIAPLADLVIAIHREITIQRFIAILRSVALRWTSSRFIASSRSGALPGFASRADAERGGNAAAVASLSGSIAARGRRCRGAAAGRRMRQSRRPSRFESRPAIAW